MRRIFHPTTLFAISALFIFYATTIPWDFSHAPSLEGVHWIPGWDSERGRIWSIPDMVQNVVLFGPFGLFAYLGLPFVRRKGPIVGALLAGLLGLGLSLTVECLQTMSSTRSPAATDLLTNFSGALAGGIAAAIWERTVAERFQRRLMIIVETRPGSLILFLYFLAIVLGALAPFIPTLDVGMLRHQVRLFLDEPWGAKPIGGLLADGLLFGALTVLLARELPGLLKKERMSAAVSVPISIVAVACLALGLEAGQLVIIGHSPGVQDAVVALVFAVVGGAVIGATSGGTLAPAKALGELSRQKPWLVLSFGVLAPTFRALSPFELRPLAEGLEAVTVWQFVPFWALFQNINLSTFRNVFEASAFYLPLGYALFALGKSPRFGFVVCLVLAEVLEVCQILIVRRVFDITEGVYAGLMALAGAHALTLLQKRDRP